MVALRSNRPVVYPPVPAFGAPLTVRETDRAEATKPRLLDRVREAIRAHHYSRVAPSTQNPALSALLFLYREVLGLEVPWRRIRGNTS